MYILLLLLSSLAFGESFEVRALKEKTYTRDNSYCKMGSRRVELQIKSETRLTERGERKYGDYVFYFPKKLGKLLPLGHDKLNSYRFFTGQNSLCSKSFGFPLEGDKLAVLFLKENRPFLDKLTFQIFNSKEVIPLDLVETDYTTDKAEASPGGFLFRTYVERVGLEMGKLKIDNTDYLFQDRDFPIWIKYTVKGFEVSLSDSFNKFEWVSYFKDQDDFLKAAQWDESLKKFKNTVLYIAVNHQQKKQCIYLSPTKVALTGSEAWRCK